MLLIMLIISLLAITLVMFYIERQDITSPTFAFLTPFTFSAFYLYLNVDRWSVVLELNTYFVITGGCLSFVAGIWIGKAINLMIKRKKTANAYVKVVLKENNDEVGTPMLIASLGVECLCLLYCLKRIIAVVRRYGYGGSLSEMIYRYRNLNIYTTESVSLGSMGDWMYAFGSSIGYIWIYLVAKDLAKKRLPNIYVLLNLVVSLVTCLIKGGRQSAFQMIVAGFVMYLMMFLRGIKRKRLPFKKLLLYAVIGMLFISSFQTLGTLIGRTVQADFWQYLAVYISGGIRNLNEFLKVPHEAPDVFGKMSFIYFNNFLGNKLHNPKMLYALDLPYLSANGHNSGNIYTTFYAYFYDFGYFGPLLLPIIIGAASQLIYDESLHRLVHTKKRIELSVIIYGYTFYMLALSFFSNKFFEGFLSYGFFRRLIMWAIVVYVLNHVTFSNGRIKYKVKL